MMCLRPTSVPPVPEETARVARLACRGNLYLALRDRFAVFFADELFADLFAARGCPALAPWRLALVTLLQFAENLSDRQAAEAVRTRLDWKYLLGLELTDPGFDHSVLCEFRARLVTGSAETRLLEALLERFREQRLLKERGRQRTDSTHVLAGVRTLHRLELVGETLRHALNVLAQEAPDWLRTVVVPEWGERYSRRVEECRLPRGRTERDALARTIGADGARLLAALDGAEASSQWRTLPAVVTLKRVWEQQYSPEEGGKDDPPPAVGLRWRVSGELPPAAELIRSPYDPTARYSQKEARVWEGYTVHLTETCDPDTPALITDVQTAAAPAKDHEALPTIYAALQRRQLLPAEHLADAGYVDADTLVLSQVQYGVTLVGPTLPDSSWQARTQTGFAAEHFAVDWEARVAHCPAGKTSVRWQESKRRGKPVIHVDFAPADCRGCPYREQCTHTADQRRRLTLAPEAQTQALRKARERERNPAFWEVYRTRQGVEGTHSQGIRRCGLRRCRYLGEVKTRLQHLLTAAALNLVRVGYWLLDRKRAQTRVAPFARFMAVAA